MPLIEVCLFFYFIGVLALRLITIQIKYTILIVWNLKKLNLWIFSSIDLLAHI